MSILVWCYIVAFLAITDNIRLLTLYGWQAWKDGQFSWIMAIALIAHITLWLLFGLLAVSASLVQWGDQHSYHLAKGGLRAGGFTAIAWAMVDVLGMRLWLQPKILTTLESIKDRRKD